MRPALAFLYNFSLALRTRFALLCFAHVQQPLVLNLLCAHSSQFAVHVRARQGAGTTKADRGCHDSGRNNKAKTKTDSPL